MAFRVELDADEARRVEIAVEGLLQFFHVVGVGSDPPEDAPGVALNRLQHQAVAVLRLTRRAGLAVTIAARTPMRSITSTMLAASGRLMKKRTYSPRWACASSTMIPWSGCPRRNCSCQALGAHGRSRRARCETCCQTGAPR